MDCYSLEMYTVSDEGVTGWDIEIGKVFATDRKNAIERTKAHFGKNFDCVIQCYQVSEGSEFGWTFCINEKGEFYRDALALLHGTLVVGDYYQNDTEAKIAARLFQEKHDVEPDFVICNRKNIRQTVKDIIDARCEVYLERQELKGGRA